LEGALAKMPQDECEHLTQLAQDAQKAEDLKRRRWFYTQGYPGTAILSVLILIFYCFRNYLYQHNLTSVSWMALYMVWIPFMQKLWAHLPDNVFMTFLQCFTTINFSVSVLLIVYFSALERGITLFKLESIESTNSRLQSTLGPSK